MFQVHTTVLKNKLLCIQEMALVNLIIISWILAVHVYKFFFWVDQDMDQDIFCLF